MKSEYAGGTKERKKDKDNKVNGDNQNYHALPLATQNICL